MSTEKIAELLENYRAVVAGHERGIESCKIEIAHLEKRLAGEQAARPYLRHGDYCLSQKSACELPLPRLVVADNEGFLLYGPADLFRRYDPPATREPYWLSCGNIFDDLKILAEDRTEWKHSMLSLCAKTIEESSSQIGISVLDRWSWITPDDARVFARALLQMAATAERRAAK
jgi:hypothetical protein